MSVPGNVLSSSASAAAASGGWTSVKSTVREKLNAYIHHLYTKKVTHSKYLMYMHNPFIMLCLTIGF